MIQRRVGILKPEFNETVLINQTSFDSEYFRLDSMPESLTAGKNIFKIFGNNQLLASKSQILIQVTDVNGAAVYHHVNNYVDPGGRIVVGIWIYPETPPGLGRIEILGVANQRPDGRSIPQSFRNRYNVKWSKELIIQPDAINDTPIIFQKVPGVKIFENEREYLTQTYLAGSSIASQSVGQLSYTYSGFGDATITMGNADPHGLRFSASMAGGLLTIEEPNFTLPSNYSLQPGTMDNETGNLPAYTSYISQVINYNTIKVDPYVLPVQSETSVSPLPGSGRSVPVTSTVNSAYPVTSFGLSNYSIEWQQDAILATGSLNSQSFASITMKNIDPIAGSVHKIKTYMKSAGFADFDLVSTQLLQERDLLINVDSDLAFDRIGDYKSQEIINNFWHSESVNQSGHHPYALHDDSIMISSLKISGSGELSGSSNYPALPLATDPYVKVYSKPNIDLFQNNEYQIKFRVANTAEGYRPPPLPTPAGVIGQISSSLMDVYISGSNIPNSDTRNLGHKLVSLETENAAPHLVNSVTNFINISTLANQTSTPIRLPFTSPPTLTNVTLPANFDGNTTLEVNPNDMPFMDEKLLEVGFTPDFDTDAHIVFAVTRGNWYLSDVSLEGASDFGFTPNHTFFEIPIQTPQADDILDFKFEFYNSRDQIANISLTTQSLDFVGSNLFISGNDNILSGSVNIGNGIIMQGFRAD